MVDRFVVVETAAVAAATLGIAGTVVVVGRANPGIVAVAAAAIVEILVAASTGEIVDTLFAVATDQN